MSVTPLSPVVVACRRALALCALAIVAASPSLAQGNPAATRSAADSAMTRERFCDAAYLYRTLDEQSGDATTALKGAEALAQGGDRAGAVAVLEAFAVRFPGHPLQGGAAKRLELIKTAIGKVGPGSSCPIPPPACGNGVVEGQETCDDGNRVDADACPATCIVPGAVVAPPVVTPPVVAPPVVTPPVGKPPVVTPPVVTPPVVTPPVVTTPVVTPPVTTTATPPIDETPSTTDRLPEDGQTPVATTIEPVAPVEPPPPPPPERSDTVEPTVDEEPEVPAGPGPPIAGIAVSTFGGLALVGGGGALVIGVLPAISYFSGRGGQAAAVADYEAAADGFERRQAAGAAADARAAQVRDSTSWNTQGRFLVIGGSVTLAAGVGALIGGIVMIASHGGGETDTDEAPARPDSDDDDDAGEAPDDNQKEEE